MLIEYLRGYFGTVEARSRTGHPAVPEREMIDPANPGQVAAYGYSALGQARQQIRLRPRRLRRLDGGNDFPLRGPLRSVRPLLPADPGGWGEVTPEPVAADRRRTAVGLPWRRLAAVVRIRAAENGKSGQPPTASAIAREACSGSAA